MLSGLSVIGLVRKLETTMGFLEFRDQRESFIFHF